MARAENQTPAGSGSLFEFRSRASQALEQEPSRAWVEILARDVVALTDDLEETRQALKEEMAWDMGGVPENEWKRRALEAEGRAERLSLVLYPPQDSPQRDDASGEDGATVGLAAPSAGSTGVPHLERACELLWQAGHPAIAEALEREVNAALETDRQPEAVSDGERLASDQKGGVGDA